MDIDQKKVTRNSMLAFWQCCVKWNVPYYALDKHIALACLSGLHIFMPFVPIVTHPRKKIAMSCAYEFIPQMTFSSASAESLFCSTELILSLFILYIFTQKICFCAHLVSIFFVFEHIYSTRDERKWKDQCKNVHFCKVISLLFVCIMQAIYEIVKQLPKIMRFSGF